MRRSHKGKPRGVVRKKTKVTGKPPVASIPFFSFRNFPLIRKKLVQLVRGCRERKDTGMITTAECCRVEHGKVFRCLKYGYEPAKFFDCMACQQSIAVQQKAPWIKPLVQLSKGVVPTEGTELKAPTRLPEHFGEA